MSKITSYRTHPDGYNADNSRKIGGFHYGHIRKVSTDGRWIPVDSEGTKFGIGATIWQDNVTTGIVPNSVWDLKHRPKCSPEGMVKVGNYWIDIYQSSVRETISYDSARIKGGLLQSVYGAMPVNGINFFNYSELAVLSGKRLPNYNESSCAAFGNPGGRDDSNDYGWTNLTNTSFQRTGCSCDDAGNFSPTGYKKYAISAYNICDSVGNLNEVLNGNVTRWDRSGPDEWQYLNSYGTDMGNAYYYKEDQFVVPYFGGTYAAGANVGSRSVLLQVGPMAKSLYATCRLVCAG